MADYSSGVVALPAGYYTPPLHYNTQLHVGPMSPLAADVPPQYLAPDALPAPGLPSADEQGSVIPHDSSCVLEQAQGSCAIASPPFNDSSVGAGAVLSQEEHQFSPQSTTLSPHNTSLTSPHLPPHWDKLDHNSKRKTQVGVPPYVRTILTSSCIAL